MIQMKKLLMNLVKAKEYDNVLIDESIKEVESLDIHQSSDINEA